MKCTKCPNLIPDTYVPPTGPVEARIALVGEAPGATEVLERKPFVGGAGKTLDMCLKSAGLNRAELFITNVCKCRPPDNRTPTPAEIENCKPLLFQELMQLPNLEWVVALGETAAQALTGKDLSWRGMIVSLQLGNREVKVLITWHPAYAMRKREELNTLVHDLHKILNPPPTYPQAYLFDASADHAKIFLQNCTEPTAVDIETAGEEGEGLNPFTDTIIGVAFCPRPGIAMNIVLDSQDKWKVFKEFMEDPTKQKVLQNATFDMTFMRTHGIQPRGVIWDTAAAMHVIHGDMPKSLEYLRSLYTTLPPYKKEFKNKRTGVAHLTKQQLSLYNCTDVDVTKRVMLEQLKYMDEKDRKTLDRLVQYLYLAVDMRVRGICVDELRLGKHILTLKPVVEKLEFEFSKKWGASISSPKQLSNLLKLDTTSEEALQEELNKIGPGTRREMIETILKYREASKALSTFLVGTLHLIGKDGRVHPDWKPTGTDTGRWACKNPNMQNFPEKYRDIFVPTSGYVFIDADYKQLELYTAAILAEDYELVEAIKKGRDVHEEVRQEMSKVAPATRSHAKGLVFGTIYGLTPRSAAQRFKVPEPVVIAWQNIVVGMHPKLKQLQLKHRDMFLRKGYVESAFGRKKWCENPQQALNHPVQSTAAEVTLTALLKLSQIPGVYPLITVHDENVVEVKQEEVEVLKPQIEQIITNPVPELCDYFPAKIWVCDRWQEV